jgi:hypothetical protein
VIVDGLDPVKKSALMKIWPFLAKATVREHLLSHDLHIRQRITVFVGHFVDF